MILVSASFSKLAVVAFLQRMHGPNDRNRIAFLWTVAGSNALVNLVSMSLLLTQCTPIAKIWNDFTPGDCGEISRAEDFGYFQGSTLRPFISRYKRALADLPRLVSTLRFYSRSLPGNFLLGVATEKVREDRLMYIDGTGCNVSFLHKGVICS